MALTGYRGTFRFRDFVLDVAAYELRRNGHPVRLERQPMDLLILLVGRRGQLVSRSQIVDALWGKDVFVDVENGVNTAIRKLRQALRDSPDAPTFIETVPGRGYRFIGTVDVLPDVVPSPLPPAAAPPSVVVGAQTLPAWGQTAAAEASVAVPEGIVGERTAGRRAGARLVLGALTVGVEAGG
jgi:DNA-binding winged helix-turn-helix (wHTH) protein